MSGSAFEQWLTDEARAWDERGLTRVLRASDTTGLLDLAGNDYLGLSRHPDVVEAAVEATRRFGAGATASRLVSGTLTLHEELEHELASLTGAPAALVLSTGYHANLAAVTALVDADTLVVSDAHVHASLIDACRLSRGAVTVTPHNDVAAVEDALATRTQARAVVLVESIYSVLGDAAPLTDLAAACEAHGAVLLADEAHGLGVAGDGRGLLHTHGLSAHPWVVATGTLSKSFGAQGGVVLGSPLVRDRLVNRARPFIYDTGLAPAATGAALAAVRIVHGDPALAGRVRSVAATLAGACGVDAPAGAVLSVPTAGPREALAGVEEAAARGVRIGCFRPPSTPDGISRLRLTAHADLTESQLALAESVLRDITGGLR